MISLFCYSQTSQEPKSFKRSEVWTFGFRLYFCLEVLPHLHVPALLIVSLSLQHRLLLLLLQFALLQLPGPVTGLDLHRKLWIHFLLQSEPEDDRRNVRGMQPESRDTCEPALCQAIPTLTYNTDRIKNKVKIQSELCRMKTFKDKARNIKKASFFTPPDLSAIAHFVHQNRRSHNNVIVDIFKKEFSGD